MRKMNSTRSSEIAALLAVLAVSLAAVGVAGAITTSASDAPAEAAVGSEVTVTINVTDLYTDAPTQWRLRGETNLTNVSGWTVRKVTPGGDVTEETYEGNAAFETAIDADENLERVELRITGDVPAVENYTYAPREEFVLASLSQVQGDNSQEITTWTTHHYTNESRQAREAIAEAEDAIDDAGGHEEAEGDLDQAISAYDNGNFENAVSNAEDALAAVEQAEQSKQTTQTILYVVGGLVVLALIGGGVYYYRSQQDSYDKLR